MLMRIGGNGHPIGTKEAVVPPTTAANDLILLMETLLEGATKTVGSNSKARENQATSKGASGRGLSEISALVQTAVFKATEQSSITTVGDLNQCSTSAEMGSTSGAEEEVGV